ncbi:HPr kinase/phosphatase C-terminal domain-containing protein [Aliiroseovarius sp. S1339]|uniref:HPr kinase/phosphorylase n=1 Tax=Aliiroseovarius sp. S1339 TaxID=2936990 RepID=UPI0020BF9624|nr:HPr kinase/phosphatase C-terminal domain-containing protein [Aliiroseovarius sp. S1339]MCK8463896.1 HPr kinase/phosphatase C-terminal domain-containing protein [Aliiroseovarius sp. S1339]
MSEGGVTGPLGFHATTIAVGESAAMITGPSGSGKSSLALELIGLGAKLVADDLSLVELKNDVLHVLAPDRLQGVIEARGVGLIHVPWISSARLQLVVDLSENELERHPQSHRVTTVAGCDIDLVLRVDAPYFACAVYHLLRNGGYAETS